MKNSIIKMKVIKIKMELKLENVCPCLAAPFHAQPEDGTDLDNKIILLIKVACEDSFLRLSFD